MKKKFGDASASPDKAVEETDWKRFEAAVDAAVKSGPKHKSDKKKADNTSEKTKPEAQQE